MSKYILPAEKIIQGLEQWLIIAMNDHRGAMKALQLQDEEEHKGALIIGHSYVFAIKAAHDALFSEDKIPEELEKQMDTPEKRVIYFAQKMIDAMEKPIVEAAPKQPTIPGLVLVP